MEKKFAEMFIERIRRQTDYNFIVINREGIIIAATERERVGVFHEASFVMMRDGIGMITVLPEEVRDYLGAKPGIDVPIEHDNEVVGALGITGNADEVKPIVIAVKMTIEAMLEYELLKEKATKKNNDQELFFSLLLSNKLAKSEQLESLAKRLGYSRAAMRIPIVFVVETAGTKALSVITEADDFSSQDFAFTNMEHEVVVFRRLNEKPGMLFGTFRQSVMDFLKPVCEMLTRHGIKYKYYIGSIQNNLNNYSFAYRHCCWMVDNQRSNDFFYNHLDDYIKSQVPMLELNGIFQPVLSLFDEPMRKNYMEIVSLLERNNYNLVTSSKELYLHKNTLIFRLNKIRDFLHVNPIQNAGDRTFMDYLCYYMCMQHRGVYEAARFDTDTQDNEANE